MYEGKNTREEETLTRRENRRRGPPPNSRSGDLGSLSRIPPRRPSRSNLLDESGHSVSSRMSNVPSQRNSGAQRSHVRRSQSFKRTAGGSAATATSLLGPAMTAQDLLGSSDPDLLNTSDGSINTTGMIPTSTISTVGAPAPPPANMAPASITRPRLQSGASGGSNNSGGKQAFSKQTSTRNFVKNFLEDYDDEYDAPIGGATSTVPASPSSRNKPGIQQFDAETQRNVHRSLLNPTAGNKFNATAMAAPSASYHQTRGSGSGNGGQPNANLFQTREDFHNIDQSVNLMDAEAGKYESKDSNKRRDQHASKMQHMQQSMVEIFLQDLSPNTMGEGGKKNKRSSIASPWYHPHRQAQWDRMTTWEKIVDVAARLLIPLFLCAMLAMVVLVIVMVYHSTAGTHSNVEAVSSGTPPPAIPPVVPDEQQAMMTFLSERKLVSVQDLQDPKSPSSKALQWIAQDPIAMAGLPTSGRRLQKEQHGDSAEDQLVQRFVLAVLYYTWMPNGMGGGSLQQAAANAFAGMSLKPNDQQQQEGGPWLTAQSECQWKGISCHDDLQELRSRVTTTTQDRSFPTGIAGGQVVRKLNLTQHDLTGTLPSVLTALSELRELDLRGNKLTGDLDGIDWTQWSQSLEYLLLGDNQITGTVPEEWTALRRIIDIDLSNNRLAGSLPAFTDGQDPLQELENLFLDQNFLSGTIPDSMLRDMPNVNDLDLSSNTLAGTLPVIALQELHELRFLNLANNALTGALPHQMSKKLDTLTLADNQITGTIPNSLLAASKRIRHLNLSQNQLQGQVPEKLGDLTHLQELRLESNPNLQGAMPSSVCALKEEQQGNSNHPLLLQVTADCKTGAVTCTCCDQCF